METLAVVCDGVEECADGSDEGRKCSNNNLMFWGIFGSLALLSIIAFIIRYRNKGVGVDRISKDNLPEDWRELSSILNKETFEDQHDSEEFQGKINLLILVNKHYKDDDHCAT